MRIVCVGGGPAGLYFAILSKLREPDARVSVYERNPAGITFGWGVTFSDDVLDSLYAGDPVSAREIQRNPASWHNQIARVAGRRIGHMGGYGFAIGRHALLKILAKRAGELGVDIHYDYVVDPELTDFADADLILASDGVNSTIRQRYAQHFGPGMDYGANYYTWLGATKAFCDFTYAFEWQGHCCIASKGSSPRLKAAKQASQSLWTTMTTGLPSPAAGGLSGADETNSSGLIAQCKVPSTGTRSAGAFGVSHRGAIRQQHRRSRSRPAQVQAQTDAWPPTTSLGPDDQRWPCIRPKPALRTRRTRPRR